ncbi:MAG TPA: HAD family phosphatase [Povalibacter sp.]|uniref:HAD family hydrolase n=1 Tax=Povalibacter sp. TaxID=1962978 RepID=UPI002C0B6D7A|nr:HAD family phosphatase [Povalibacter sp.]HMN46478.1 HAD family phosphatase [Povalibacter sp.]
MALGVIHMSVFELVIFDCDGVLVDSESITNQVFCTMLNNLGVPVSLQDMFERFVGLSMPQCIDLITEMHGEPPPSTFVDELRQRAASALKDQIRSIPGVERVLASLDVPYCVASSGEHEKIRLTLGATGLLKRFEGRIFSVVDVAKPKPAPDVFLFAARQIGVPPSACAVVEDTPTGIRAAVAAGMHTFGFAANTPAHRLIEAGAHHVFSDMTQLLELLNTVQPRAAADSHRQPLQ